MGSLSSVLKKFIVAISGFLLVLFVLAHLIGNLQVYLGPEYINGYAKHIQSLGFFLWIIRFILFGIILFHIYFAIDLAIRSLYARGSQKYIKKTNLKSSLASRTMFISGSFIFIFIVFHIFHFTIKVMPDYDLFEHGDVYSMIVFGFKNVYISFLYIFSMILLGFHLIHGIESIFQSLGFYHKRYSIWIKNIAIFITSFIVLGNISIPVSVMIGFIK